MRFIDLELTAFQAIGRAKVEFAPGLNVLYGPNDLGKSTLVTALRAALLLPARSGEGKTFTPWYRDAMPAVTVTFEDDDARRWQVHKTFGERGGAAELRSSKDGLTFSIEETGRVVDERLRAILGWGVTPSGGRGMPESFLVNALLGGQTGVEALLSRGLGQDEHESGKARLTKALAALAQDPLFKQVLGRAQTELDVYLTAGGKRRSGSKSPFAANAEQIKRLQADLAEVKHRLEQSAALETQLVSLRRLVGEAAARTAEAESLLGTVRVGLELGRTRSAAVEKVSRARAALAEVDVVVEQQRIAGLELKKFEQALGEQQAALAQTQSQAAQTTAAVQAAEGALHRAQSKAGAQARELQRASLQRELAELEVERTARQRELEAHLRAKDVAARLSAARDDRSRAAAQSEQLKARAAVLETDVDAAQSALDLARAIIDYGQWREAERRAAQAAAAERDALSFEQQAAKLEASQRSLEAALEADTQALEARRQNLPDAAKLKALDDLERQLKLADAAIGGGVTVVVRPSGEVNLHAEVDDEAPIDEARLTKERTFDAERKVALTIGSLVGIEITAGSKEHRKLRDTLAKRWRAEGLSTLATAEVDSIAALRELMTRVGEQAEALRARRAELERGWVEARTLRERASLVRSQPVDVSAAVLQQRRDRIPQSQLAVLEQHFETLGASWEVEAAKLRSQHETVLASLSRERADLGASMGKHSAQLEQLDAQLASLSKEAPALPGAQGLEAVQQVLARLATTRAAKDSALKALEAEQGVEVQSAQVTLQQAREAASRTGNEVSAAARGVEETTAALNERRGLSRSLEERLLGLDRLARSKQLAAAEAELSGLPPSPVFDAQALALAEQTVAAARADRATLEAQFHQGEGALSKIGGPHAREQVDQLEAALAAALAREAELELELSAWKLLHETLRAEENAEGSHLGRALVGPLTTQFAALTQARYGQLSMQADLTVEGLQVNGTQIDASSVLEALSVGTRDQLATLLRVALARELRTALVLDDHLVHTDPARLGWFVEALTATARTSQVIVITCRPRDYLSEVSPAAVRDLPGGLIRAIDLGRAIEPWPERTPPPKG